MLSIAHYHPCLTGSGGDRVSEAELRYLAAQGHRISFLVAYEPCGYEERFASLGANWKAFYGNDVSPREGRMSARELMPEAVRFLEAQKADLLHCHNVSILPQALILSRTVGIPLFITVHTRGEKWSKWRWSYKPKRRTQFRMIREAMAASKGLFAVSNPVAEHAKALFGSAAQHIQFLPNPIHDAFFEPALSVERDIDVVILGRPVAMKNPKLVGAVSAQLLGARISWVGATGEEEAIREAIPSPQARTAIEFLGKREPSEVRQILLRSKVLLHASLREGFGLAPAEAALSGCRLALSDIPALRAHFDIPGSWFFPPKDVAQAVGAVRSALEPAAPVPDASKLDLLSEAAHGERLLQAYRSAV